MAGNSSSTWRSNLTLNSNVSPFDSPLPMTHQAFKDVRPVSWTRFNIAGLLVTVYGLDELPRDAENHGIACCWLLHGRGDTQDSMSFTAAAFLNAWSAKRVQGQPHLICVSFDQRNHGSRLVDNLANESWKGGNPTHGPDMFSLYSGTARDVSHLLPLLPSYLYFEPVMNICCGVSLGGHATWQVLMHEPAVTAGIVVIGCPDYTRLMLDRAIRSSLETCIKSAPPGRDFVGSPDFPRPLIELVERFDPAGMLLNELDWVRADDHLNPPSPHEKARLRPLLTASLAGKKILNLAGGKDRLVPYEQGEPFLTWLKLSTDPHSGWCSDLEIAVEDVVDPSARHEFSGPMRKDAERWLCDLLAGDGGSGKSSWKL